MLLNEKDMIKRLKEALVSELSWFRENKTNDNKLKKLCKWRLKKLKQIGEVYLPSNASVCSIVKMMTCHISFQHYKRSRRIKSYAQCINSGQEWQLLHRAPRSLWFEVTVPQLAFLLLIHKHTERFAKNP